MNEQTRANMIKIGEKSIASGNDCIAHWSGQYDSVRVAFWTRYVKAYQNAVEALKAGTDVEFSVVGDGSESYRLIISNDKVTRDCVITYTVTCYDYNIKRYELALSAFGNAAIAAMVELYQSAEKKAINKATWAAGTPQRGWSNWVTGR